MDPAFQILALVSCWVEYLLHAEAVSSFGIPKKTFGRIHRTALVIKLCQCYALGNLLIPIKSLRGENIFVCPADVNPKSRGGQINATFLTCAYQFSGAHTYLACTKHKNVVTVIKKRRADWRNVDFYNILFRFGQWYLLLLDFQKWDVWVVEGFHRPIL